MDVVLFFWFAVVVIIALFLVGGVIAMIALKILDWIADKWGEGVAVTLYFGFWAVAIAAMLTVIYAVTT